MAYDPNMDDDRRRALEDEINARYRDTLGRDMDDNERSSEVENYEKYGGDAIRKNLESRKGNTPGDEDGDGNDDRDYGSRNTSTQSSNSGGGGGGNNVIQSWQSMPDTFTNAITEQNKLLKEQQDFNRRTYEEGTAREQARLAELKQIEEQRRAEVAAQEAQRKAKADELYGQLRTRSQTALDVNPNTSYIKAQVDPYRAAQTRSMRDFISDTAEAEGPLGNIRGEERMAAERVGQNTANFQGGLIGEDIRAKRAEIADALNSMRGMLSADQQANLQSQMDTLDNQLAQVGMGTGIASGAGGLGMTAAGLRSGLTLGEGNLDLGFADLSLRDQLGNKGLDIQSQLGNRGFDLQSLLQEMNNRHFYDDLGLRTGVARDNSDRWRSGF